ncbi:MAG TPA: hypothetical protein VFH61_14740 [Thermoleophilia bacterium]|nr:hypothetical protein [Thermoleophilia bacterium]
MPKPQWGDFGAIWKTVREVDVNAIRCESEYGIGIVCVGQPAALWWVDHLLHEGPNRYPLGAGRLALVPLDTAGDHANLLRTADLVVLALDAAMPPEGAELAEFERLSAAPRSGQILLLFGEDSGAQAPRPASFDRGATTLVDPRSPGAIAAVAAAVLGALPAEAHLAAARRLPGLRPLFAARLTGEVATSNAAFALASGVPSLVPFLGLPISAADTVVLTKNQALMVYRLALACGAPPDFRRRMMEITPVIGGAVMWRQIAGTLAGLVPGYGIAPKTAVAFGGTYAVGLAATRWYETGLLTKAERKRITAEASARARDVATVMAAQARTAGGRVGAQAQRAAQGVRAGAGRVIGRDRDAIDVAGEAGEAPPPPAGSADGA